MTLDKKMRILIVDDYTTMLRILRNLLRQLDFNNVEQLEQALAGVGKLAEARAEVEVYLESGNVTDRAKAEEFLRRLGEGR